MYGPWSALSGIALARNYADICAFRIANVDQNILPKPLGLAAQVPNSDCSWIIPKETVAEFENASGYTMQLTNSFDPDNVSYRPW